MTDFTETYCEDGRWKGMALNLANFDIRCVEPSTSTR
jgi:hypothetical protein